MWGHLYYVHKYCSCAIWIFSVIWNITGKIYSKSLFSSQICIFLFLTLLFSTLSLSLLISLYPCITNFCWTSITLQAWWVSNYITNLYKPIYTVGPRMQRRRPTALPANEVTPKAHSGIEKRKVTSNLIMKRTSWGFLVITSCVQY